MELACLFFDRGARVDVKDRVGQSISTYRHANTSALPLDVWGLILIVEVGCGTHTNISLIDSFVCLCIFLYDIPLTSSHCIMYLNVTVSG